MCLTIEVECPQPDAWVRTGARHSWDNKPVVVIYLLLHKLRSKYKGLLCSIFITCCKQCDTDMHRSLDRCWCVAYTLILDPEQYGVCADDCNTTRRDSMF